MSGSDHKVRSWADHAGEHSKKLSCERDPPCFNAGLNETEKLANETVECGRAWRFGKVAPTAEKAQDIAVVCVELAVLLQRCDPGLGVDEFITEYGLGLDDS